MTRQDLQRHMLVLMATLGGIVGMGMIFTAAMHGNIYGVFRGIPFLLMGLWWAGRELSRSMIASRRRQEAARARLHIVR